MDKEEIIERIKDDFFGSGKEFLVIYGNNFEKIDELCRGFSADTGYHAFPSDCLTGDERAFEWNYNLLESD